MDENEITQRLRDAGRRRVPADVRAGHLIRMQPHAPTAGTQKRFGRLAVAAAAFVGFAVGSTGFAMAGALPDPAQQVAHDVLSVVQVDVPDRPDNRGRCVSDAAKADADPVQKKAAKDACKAAKRGKPDHAGKGKGRPDHAGPPAGRIDDGDPCKGPPPWAGKGAKPTAEQKEAFEAERSACPDGDGDDPADEQADALEDQREAEEQEAEGRQDPPADAPATPPVEVPAPIDETDTGTGTG